VFYPMRGAVKGFMDRKNGMMRRKIK